MFINHLGFPLRLGGGQCGRRSDERFLDRGDFCCCGWQRGIDLVTLSLIVGQVLVATLRIVAGYPTASGCLYGEDFISFFTFQCFNELNDLLASLLVFAELIFEAAFPVGKEINDSPFVECAFVAAEFSFE